MKRGYNELVGLQATFSRVVPRYTLTHHYRWSRNGKKATTGTLRGFDLHRGIPISEVLFSLGDAYAPAILTVWRLVTKGCLKVLFQFEVNATPNELELPGEWHVYAQE